VRGDAGQSLGRGVNHLTPDALTYHGARTEAVYRRYTITSDADQREAAARLGPPRGSALETRSVSS
jgi:hypothetical protein